MPEEAVVTGNETGSQEDSKVALISPDNTNHSVKLLDALTTNRCHIDMALTDDC